MMPLPRTPPRLITLTLLTALSVLTLNMILPSLPSMARDLAAREAVVALSVSGYMLVSGLFQLKDIGAGDGPGLVPTVVATLVSFVVGYAAIAWLLRYLTTHSTLVFVIYRVALGLLLVGLLAGGQLEPR